jgi:hypothetical protein
VRLNEYETSTRPAKATAATSTATTAYSASDHSCPLLVA